MHSLKSKRQSTLKNAQTMADLKDTIAKFTSALSFQEKGKFPSQRAIQFKCKQLRKLTHGSSPISHYSPQW